MKKKLFIIAAAALVLGLAGCGNTQTKIPEEVALADPWTEYDSLKQAEEAVGFSISVPDEMSVYGEESYNVFAGLKEIEIQYGEGEAFVRKAEDDGDISGDYEKYAVTKEVDVNGNKVTIKGVSENSINLATWLNGKYSYAVYIDEGVTEREMTSLVSEVG